MLVHSPASLYEGALLLTKNLCVSDGANVRKGPKQKVRSQAAHWSNWFVRPVHLDFGDRAYDVIWRSLVFWISKHAISMHARHTSPHIYKMANYLGGKESPPSLVVCGHVDGSGSNHFYMQALIGSGLMLTNQTIALKVTAWILSLSAQMLLLYSHNEICMASMYMYVHVYTGKRCQILMCIATQCSELYDY